MKGKTMRREKTDPKKMYPDDVAPWFKRAMARLESSIQQKIKEEMASVMANCTEIVNGVRLDLEKVEHRLGTHQHVEAFGGRVVYSVIKEECECEDRKVLELLGAVWFQEGVWYRSFKGKIEKYPVCETCNKVIGKSLVDVDSASKA